MKRIAIAVATICAPLLFLAPAAHAQRAQVSNDDEFSSRGGVAGCFDPNRVTVRQREQLERMGSEPCGKRPTSVAGGWDRTADGKGAVVDDGNGIGLTLGVLCERGGMSLSLISARPETDRQLAGLRNVSVSIAGMSGTVTLTLPRQSDGDFSSMIDAAQLAALKSSNAITVTTPRWTARFSGSGATRALAVLPCRATAAATSTPMSAAPTRAWLIGAWAPQGAYCASSGPIMFKEDGTYFSGTDVAGQWSVGTSTITFVQRGKRPSSPQFARLGPDELRIEATRFKRCPTDGGPEPWHPGERIGN